MAIKIVTAPDSAEARPLLRNIATHGVPSEAVEIYKGRNQVLRYFTPSLGAINIKAFQIPHLINRLVYTNFRKSKARRSYEHALRLLELGFLTPRPIGYIEIKSGALLGQSFYLCEHLDDVTQLRPWDITDKDDPEILAEDLGTMISRLHKANIWFKDFSQGNVLKRRRPDGHYDLFLVDINRMSFDCRNPSKLMTNFTHAVEDKDMLLAVARAYARHSNLDPATVEKAAAAIHRSSNYPESLTSNIL